MRVEVDFDLCQGHAECRPRPPVVRRRQGLGGQGPCQGDRSPPISSGRQAAKSKYRPTQALRLVED